MFTFREVEQDIRKGRPQKRKVKDGGRMWSTVKKKQQTYQIKSESMTFMLIC